MTVAGATFGLFADGLVGEAVLSVLARRCPDNLAYVATTSANSRVASCHEASGLSAPLLSIDRPKQASDLPIYEGEAPQVVFLAWWPKIVSQRFLSAGQAVTLNMHPSLLPYGRGKDPNFWALAENEPFGVTIHHVDSGVDTGGIAFQAELASDWTDTGESLYGRAQEALVLLFEQSLDAMLSLDIPCVPQAEGKPPRRRAELASRSELDIDAPTTARSVLNLLRARTFPPFPGCRFTDETGSYQVRVQIEKAE